VTLAKENENKILKSMGVIGKKRFVKKLINCQGVINPPN